jgi:C4-type Zn-finger protein
MKSKKWLDAAILLGNDPSAKVRCPVCEDADLSVHDIYPVPDAAKFERYMECPSCHARNIMLMKRKTSTEGGPVNP